MPAIPTEKNGGNHTPGFTASARTEGFVIDCPMMNCINLLFALTVAHRETMAVTKGLALTGFRVLDDEEYFDRVSAYS
jgi:hypothetical protein